MAHVPVFIISGVSIGLPVVAILFRIILPEQTRRHDPRLCTWKRNKRNPKLLLVFPMKICKMQDGGSCITDKAWLKH